MTNTNPNAKTQVANLLVGFRSAIAQHRNTEETQAQKKLPLLRRLLGGFRDEHEKWAARQSLVADDFNVLQVLGIEYDELFHSKLLAWLLDPRIEHGSHAQGNLGFRLLLEEFRPELDSAGKLQIERYAERYRVRREVSSDESRVDIEVVASGKFIIHIENEEHTSELQS